MSDNLHDMVNQIEAARRHLLEREAVIAARERQLDDLLTRNDAVRQELVKLLSAGLGHSLTSIKQQ